jgi:sulfur-carrier protein
MNVEIRLFASFRQDRFSRKQFEFPEETMVVDVLRRLDIAPEEVAILLVNGQEAAAGRLLQNGDFVSLFPLVAGG